MFVWKRLVIGPNKPTPFAVLTVRRDKPPGQKKAVALKARNSVNTITIKVISSDFTESYSLKCQHFSPHNLCHDETKEKW